MYGLKRTGTLVTRILNLAYECGRRYIMKYK